MAGTLLTCCLTPTDKQALNHSKDIDKQLQRDKNYIRREVKVLLLGAGESGKSTFLKQMKIIHEQQFTDQEVKEFRNIIYGNIIKGMKVLADARDKLGIPWGDSGNEKHAEFVMSFNTQAAQLEPSLFVQYVQPCVELWKDSGIQSAFDRRREFQLVSIFWWVKDVEEFLTKRKIAMPVLLV